MPAARGVFILMAFAVGVIVGNIYYIQPLLIDIGNTFTLSVRAMGGVALVFQLGTAFGMFSFVPLGDILDRRKLILSLIAASAVSLLVFASCNSIPFMLIGAFAVGLTACVVHILVPFAAELAPPETRGQAVGTVLSGLLIGILLARTASGFIGGWLGWRAVFYLAALLMVLLMFLLAKKLPHLPPSVSMTYRELMISLKNLVRDEPQLREAAFTGSMFFASFSAFWTTLVYLLAQPPYHYGSETAGLFGVIGATGAVAAPLVGRFADRSGPRKSVAYSLVLGIFSFGILAVGGHSIFGLVVGVILMDLAVQSGHVSNQARIYALQAGARSRLNTVYMVCYFLGGALGSAGGAWAWNLAGWNGVCRFAITLLTLAITFVIYRWHKP